MVETFYITPILISILIYFSLFSFNGNKFFAISKLSLFIILLIYLLFILEDQRFSLIINSALTALYLMIAIILLKTDFIYTKILLTIIVASSFLLYFLNAYELSINASKIIFYLLLLFLVKLTFNIKK